MYALQEGGMILILSAMKGSIGVPAASLIVE